MLMTMKCCPKILLSSSTTMRACMSVPPPAMNGTTILTVFSGHATAACAALQTTNNASAPATSHDLHTSFLICCFPFVLLNGPVDGQGDSGYIACRLRREKPDSRGHFVSF